MTHTLYHYHHAHQSQHALRQEQEISRILRQSNSVRATLKSNEILTRKLFSKLQRYQDHSLIDLKDMLPILFETGVLQVLSSVEDAINILQDNDRTSLGSRLKIEAKFISSLWKAIDKDQISGLELKRIIYLFHEKRGNALSLILQQMFESQSAAKSLYRAWNQLQADKFYYRKTNDRKKSVENKSAEHKEPGWSQEKKFQPLSTLDKNKLKSKKRSKSSLNDTLCHTKKLKSEQDQPFFERLYQVQFYNKKEKLKQEHELELQRIALDECTFKPETKISKLSLSRSSSQHKSIEVKGYEKAVSRLKDGNRRHTEQNERSSHIPKGQNYEKVRRKSVKAPSFLGRKKCEKDEHLFSIGLEIGSKKAVLKIREKDTAVSAAQKICQIYGLNQRFQGDLEQMVQKEIDNYWAQNVE